METLTRKYRLSKTLRFELRPVGKTMEKIQEKGLLDKDEELAREYKIAKKIIDEYHKDFIERALGRVKFSKQELQDLAEAHDKVKSKHAEYKKTLSVRQAALRKKIVDVIRSTEDFDALWGKELIKDKLGIWIAEKYSGQELRDNIKVIKDFEKFTTYFRGFNKNRENMYAADDHSTAIAYRIIHENFPKFYENCKKYATLVQKYSDIDFSGVEQALGQELGGKSLKDFFSLENFENCLNQSGIDKFNTIRGGKVMQGGEKIQGVNEIINLYIQQKESVVRASADGVVKAGIRELRSCKVVALYKQILSDRESASFLPEKFEDDAALITALDSFYKDALIDYKDETGSTNILKLLNETMTKRLLDADSGKVYVKNGRGLTDISQEVYGDYGLISRALLAYIKRQKPSKKSVPTGKELKSWDDWLKKTKYFSIYEIQIALNEYFDSLEDGNDDLTKKKSGNVVLDYFSVAGHLERIERKHAEVLPLLTVQYCAGSKTLIYDKASVAKIKDFLDSLQAVVHLLKPLYITQDKAADEKESEVFDKDDSFYGDFDLCYEQLSKIIPVYNKCRNYLTQKPYSVEKYKLNFENSTLLAGFDVNKETDNAGIILRNDGSYYLAIMDKKHSRVFNKEFSVNDKLFFEKMEYKFFKDVTTMIPKCSTQLNVVKLHFAKSNNDYLINDKSFRRPVLVTKEIFDLNNITYEGKKKFQIEYLRQSGDEKGYKSALLKWIDFCVEFLKNYKSTEGYDYSSLRPSETYERLDEFYNDVNKLLYKISFRRIPADYINKSVEGGEIYLFQIYNKDFSPHSKGRPNLHTLYWKALFDEKNLADVVYKLNGEAEIFYRKASLKYPEKVWREGYHYEQLKDKFVKDGRHVPIIKDRRYALDKFSFHVPITINFKSPVQIKFNDQVNVSIKGDPNIHILGIDRGERHLAYYSLINQNGEIIDQGSFNVISNNCQGREYRKDYHDLLDNAEKERDKARKAWDTVEKIKDIKEGYLSQVVHKISELVIKHNAIVVFEDLNFGFKRGRFRIEKQVYQKLERMLIEKFNYLVFKDRKDDAPGGILNGYQLAAPFTAFKDMGKQTGVIYYVPAYHTSKVCPATGFVNLLHANYESVKQSQDFFGKFKSIRYNSEENHFEFMFEYADFISAYKGLKRQWTVSTHGKRLLNFRNRMKNHSWDTKEIDPTEELRALFTKAGIDYSSGADLKFEICGKKEAEFLRELMRCLKIALQMRNTRTDSDEDYIISPVKDKNGMFFDSRNAPGTMPQNADANGAYHIGLKGLMLLKKINAWDGKGRLDLKITNDEWYEFVQSKAYVKP